MQFTVDEKGSGQRIDSFLSTQVPDFSRARIQKYIRAGKCLVNNEKTTLPSAKIRAGQLIDFDPPAPQNYLAAESGKLEKVYEDPDLAVIIKPAGLTSHPCPSCPEHTLVNRLLGHFPQLREQEGDRPGIVHRLDKDTTGLMLVALSERARLKLVDDFANGAIQKEYLALVHGNAPDHGECREAIGRDRRHKTRMALVPEQLGGKTARTEWKKLWQSADGEISLLKIRIHSGRTHQIRVHMSALGYPLLGDQVYASGSVRSLASRQMLHAWRLSFHHPITGKQMSFTSKMPDDMRECLRKFSKPPRRVVITGNQASGKSSFCKALADFGLPLISADQIVAELYSKAGPVGDWLRHYGFGTALLPDETIDKKKLLSLLSSDSVMRSEFEKYVHALVFDKIGEFWASQNETTAVAAEIPLYFEANGPDILKQPVFVIGIECPEQIRWKRLSEDRGWDSKKISSIESWQMPENKKMEMCDLVIGNTGSPEDLRKKAQELAGLLLEGQLPKISDS